MHQEDHLVTQQSPDMYECTHYRLDVHIHTHIVSNPYSAIFGPANSSGRVEIECRNGGPVCRFSFSSWINCKPIELQ